MEKGLLVPPENLQFEIYTHKGGDSPGKDTAEPGFISFSDDSPIAKDSNSRNFPEGLVG